MTKNFKKSLAFAMCLTFMSMQTTLASMDTGLGNGIGGAVIHGTNGGFVDMQTGNNSATLNFDGNTYVNWDSLNLNSNETLNFNAVNGANGINILNSVTGTGMSQIYGTINSNAGINQLIISNPNGVLFDGASFNAAGDVMLTTQQLGAEFNGSNMTIVPGSNAAINGVVIKDSNFNVGGEFVISAPSIDVLKTAITTGSGLKLVTRDGQNYLVTNVNGEEEKGIKVDAVSVNGNVYVLSGKDYVQFKNGGTIKGDLTVDSQGIVAVNYTNPEEKTLTITGNANIKSNGALNPRDKGNFMYLRDTKINKNLKMENSGGFLEVQHIDVDGDVELTTTDGANSHVKHFVHVVGDDRVGGNLKVNSKHNIHIGGYDKNLQALQPGKVVVGGDIDMTAENGSIAVTVDTSAKNIKLNSKNLNIMTDGKAVMTADTYEFTAKNYIGGVKNQKALIRAMEKYSTMPSISEKSFVEIAGGDLNKLETGDTGYAFVRANKDMNLNGVNANGVNVASGGDIKIEDDVHARLIKVDGETRNLRVNNEANKRDYTLRYVNIKDTKTIEIAPETEITYEMANGDQGWNKGTQTKENTYLVVPGQPDKPVINPEDNDNVKIMRNLNPDQMASAVDAQQVYTPVAFAADLDDEIDTGVRKNVDGSVTVVRSYTPVN